MLTHVDALSMLPAAFAPYFLVLIIWSAFWGGLALWHSARRGEWIWFVVMLFVHTAGILEIIYLFGFAKRKFNTLFSMNSTN